MLNFLDRKPRPRPVQPSTVESFFFVNISPLYFLVQLAVNEKTYPNICHYILFKKSIYSNQYTHVECALTPPAPKKNKTLYKSKNARNASLLYTETCIKLLRLKVLRFIPEGNKYDSIFTEGFKFPWRRFPFFLKAI